MSEGEFPGVRKSTLVWCQLHWLIVQGRKKGKITLFCCLRPLEAPSQNKGQRSGQHAAQEEALKKGGLKEASTYLHLGIKFRTMLAAISFCC